MKRIFLIALTSFIVFPLLGQGPIPPPIVNNSPKNYNLWIEGGIGTPTVGDIGLNIDCGIRYNKPLNENLSWDIVKVGANIITCEEYLAEVMTGIRGESSVLFGEVKGYATFSVGYALDFTEEEGSFKWELGLGLKLSPRLCAGIVYGTYDYIELRTLSFRVCFALF